ncbi:MAG: hypothetical protein PHG95_03300 [Patescibacteria group bacterium]|nr:hypothetical protein [Patescibacteria group bacterium]
MGDYQQDAVAEIEDIFNKAKESLLSLHHQKMELIKKFKESDDAVQAADILDKLKQLS